MKKLLAVTGVATVLVAGAFVLPTGSSAAGTADLARVECLHDRVDDRAEFIREYGRGKGAIARCVKGELRKARNDCRLEKRYEAAEFQAEYGTGPKAMARCVRDEVS